MKKFILLFIIISLSNAQEYLVKDIKEYNQVVKKIKAGDSIILKDGIWRDVDLVLKAKGSKQHPIIIKSQHKQKVIIEGKSSLTIRGRFIYIKDLVFKDGSPSRTNLITLKDCNHCIVDGILVDGFNDSNVSKRHNWIVLKNGQYNIVKNSKFTHMTNKGVTLLIVSTKEPNYDVIEHNEFSYRKRGTSNGYETIRVGNSKYSLLDYHTTIKDNLFLKCNGEYEIISNKSCSNRYIHNTFLYSEGTLTLRHGNNCLVKDNVFIGEKNNKYIGGIRVVGYNHKIIGNYLENVGFSKSRAAIILSNGVSNSKIDGYFSANNAIIQNNIIINTTYAIVSGLFYKKFNATLVPKNILLGENYFINVKHIYSYNNKKAQIILKNNHIYNNAINNKGESKCLKR